MKTELQTQHPGSVPAQTRLYYLDWLRVLAILGVVIFHAIHPFDLIDWQIKNDEQSMFITIIILFFNFWGMHLFFLLSGAGSRFALLRRTPRRYAVERVQRLLVPFVFGTLILTPLMLYFTWQHRAPQSTFTEHIAFFLRDEVLYFSPAVVKIGFHMWFLGFLFLISILALPVMVWLNRQSASRFVTGLAGVVVKRGGLLLFILPLLLVRLVLKPLFPVENDWADFALYFCYFLLGYLMYLDRRFQAAVRRDWLLLLACAVFCFVVLLVLLAVGDPFAWVEDPGLPQYYLVHGLITIDGWCWALFFLGLGMRRLDFTNPVLEYCQGAILPVFVVHQPVIIAVAYYVVQLDAGILVKLPLVVFGSLAISLGLYEFVIRRIPLLRPLFGMKTRPLASA